MPDSPKTPTGPVMLAATAVLRPGRARIGKLAGNITLPRTVSLISLLAGAVGFLVGVTIGFIFIGGIQAVLYGGTFGAAGGVFVVSYSPMKGESLTRWLGLTIKAHREQIKVDGQPVRLAVGICPISRAAAGPVHIVRGGIEVPPSQRDARGVIISPRNRNLDQSLWAESGRSKGLDWVPGTSESSPLLEELLAEAGHTSPPRSLPKDTEIPLGSRRRKGAAAEQRQPEAPAPSPAAVHPAPTLPAPQHLPESVAPEPRPLPKEKARGRKPKKESGAPPLRHLPKE